MRAAHRQPRPLWGTSRALALLAAGALAACSYPIPQARLTVQSAHFLEPTLDREAVHVRLDPLMRLLGYPVEWDVVESDSALPGRGAFQVDFTWSTKAPANADSLFKTTVYWHIEHPGQLTVILTEIGRRHMSVEGWLRWKALKEALEAHSLVDDVAIDIHPAWPTRPEDRKQFSAVTGVPLPEKLRDG